MDTSEGIWAYFAVFAGLIGAGIGLPIPEELPIIAGGIAAAHASVQVPREHPFWFIMWPICIIGVVIADGFLYGIGRWGGDSLLNLSWVRKHILRPEKRPQIEANFHRYGVKILLGARFLPGIRAGIFMMSGVLRMPLAKFLLADLIYAIPGVSAIFFLTFWFTDHFVELFKQVHGKVEAVLSLVVVSAIAAAAGYFLHSYLKSRGSTGDPHEVPIIGVVVDKIIADETPEDGERPPI